MNKFTENESYKHKMAKEVLKMWFYGGGMIGDVGCLRPNRDCGVFLEYPIVNTDEYNSITNNWDELLTDPHIPKAIDEDGNEYEVIGNEYVPTYNECISLDIYPNRIVDVVLSNKGSPEWFIEICYKNPTSQEKINELKLLGVKNLIEIDADWILNQTKKPDEIKYKQLI